MLNREQIQQNIVALEKQGAKPDEIQSWLDTIPKQSDTQSSDTQPQKEGLFKSLTKNFVRAGQTVMSAGEGLATLGAAGLAKLTGQKNVGEKYLRPFNEKVAKQDVLDTPTKAIGAGLDIGTTIGTGGIGELSGKVLLKQGLKSAIKLAVPRTALSGAINQAGQAISDNKSFEDTMKQAFGGAVGGAIGGTIMPVGQKVTNAVSSFASKKLPERFYSTFFKTSADDLAKQLRTETIAGIQKDNPSLFKDLVKQGIIKADPGKPYQINQTLAEEALQRGMGSGKTGRSLESMAKYSIQKQLELENTIRNIVGSSGKVNPTTGAVETTSKLPSEKFWVDLGNKKGAYTTLLEDLRSNLQSNGFGSKGSPGFNSSETNIIDGLLGQLNSSQGNKIPPDTALVLRRFIDGMRNTSSFNSNPNLTPKQDAYKVAADYLRGQIGKIPGIADTMKEYSFYINAANDLTVEAAKRGNKALFNLFDAVVGGSSLGTGMPIAGPSAMAAFRTIQTPSVLLFLGRQLSKTAPMFKTNQAVANKLITPITSKLGGGMSQ